jgi:hypothetical protein
MLILIFGSHELPDTNEDAAIKELAAISAAQINVTQAIRLPNVQIGDDYVSKPFGVGQVTIDDLDYASLVDMRRCHQTRQAALGVRSDASIVAQSQAQELGPGVSQDINSSLRRELIDKFNSVI